MVLVAACLIGLHFLQDANMPVMFLILLALAGFLIYGPQALLGVTAANADFINFYVGNKNRYMIDDDLITLEFTESYATEDYKKFSEIIVALHEGGIHCSVDDFGVGYSSFRVLKELDMDELKLDRLFLDKGFDIDRDDKILTTITALAKSCGMTVVMEGVENKAMYDRVVRFGIGVIQGYYYAKPIPLEEFKIFVKSNTSIRYKAVVK
jgi:EAL domain-containing protein (putative c-di-GMP-specific phosphodiesterase class I)